MYKFLIGVDEAGRGPLAGPVAVGVVLAPADFDIRAAFPGVNDSKKLSEKKREAIYAILASPEQKDVRFSVQFVDASVVDEIGITKAVLRGVEQGIRLLAADPYEAEVRLDGLLKAPSEYNQRTIIGGDATEAIISLASIAAKVERDHLMCDLSVKYPGYFFEEHKGYGTKKHYAAIEKLGLCTIHRRSFCN